MSTLPFRCSDATLVAPRSARTASWSELAAQVVDLLLVWHERVRQRRQLQGLNDHMLRDIGLGRADVAAESTKPFWRP